MEPMPNVSSLRRLPFCTALLPDESLHSWISRLHRLSGNPEERQTLHDIFGTHLLVATANLPSHLAALCSALPEHAQLSMEELIDRSTLLPYFVPFLSPEQTERCRHAMAGHNAGDMKIGIGLVASRIGGRNAFRYCPQCCAEDEKSYGSAYWHRAHSLPGVLLCHRHGNMLLEIKADLVQLRRHSLFLPTDSWVEESSTTTLAPDAPLDDLLRLAASSADLLVMPMPSLPAPLLRRFYREQACQQRWIDHHGRIQCAAVLHAVTSCSLGQAVDSDLEFFRQPQWIFKLLYKHRTAMHPLKHLALMTLLGTSTLALRAYCQYTDLQPGYDSRTRKIWRADNRLDTATLAIRRQRFLTQLDDIPARSTRDYMWLYRHDKDWLQQTIASDAKPRHAGQDKVEWDRRDQQFADQVRQHAAQLYESDTRSRISAARLARTTGRQALIEKFSGKLPLTTQAIQTLAEPLEDFQCRRLRWVVHESQVRGESPVRWRILRTAGLAPPLASRLEQELIALLKTKR
ncbi:TnsD family Tn7-like transposition protein [Rugamonas sp. DEMB1]|uniref:TnsD family Tn7-like transposition protein n=1 Tax=Rugamonas sp. DEMB1 TaxID=3039386 RepID=UPI00244CCA33|nr:TnsD family Tn7-like transposition protein [Rugamonas sp. DEMB1]WGG50472.1 TnsD family Tn7-like transposition protein [Rugamonas sp. DEMB1]